MTAPDVVGPAEACELLNISGSRLRVLANREDFPPARELTIGRVWDRAELEAWNLDRLAGTPNRRRKALMTYRQTGNAAEAARVVGVDEKQIRRWLEELELRTATHTERRILSGG